MKDTVTRIPLITLDTSSIKRSGTKGNNNIEKRQESSILR